MGPLRDASGTAKEVAKASVPSHVNRRKWTAATSASAPTRRGAKPPLRDASGTAKEVAKASVPWHVNRRKWTAATGVSALMRRGAKPQLRDASGTAKRVAKVSVPYLKTSRSPRSSQLLQLRRRHRWSPIQRMRLLLARFCSLFLSVHLCPWLLGCWSPQGREWFASCGVAVRKRESSIWRPMLISLQLKETKLSSNKCDPTKD